MPLPLLLHLPLLLPLRRLWPLLRLLHLLKLWRQQPEPRLLRFQQQIWQCSPVRAVVRIVFNDRGIFLSLCAFKGVCKERDTKLRDCVNLERGFEIN